MPLHVVVKCPICGWRIMDKITPTSGTIEIKCPKCHKVVSVDLSLRRSIRYRQGRIRVLKKVGSDNKI